MARAPVSKTGGWGFETLHPCQAPGLTAGARSVFSQHEGSVGVAVDPAKFVREVRIEAGRITWPSRKELLVTTGLVFAMAALAAAFFFVVDQLVGLAVRALFGGGL